MGKHARSSRSRAAVTTAAVAVVPALASIALSSPAYASAVQPTVLSHISTQDLVSIQAVARMASREEAQPKTYTVHDGDTLSSIAQSQCGTTADWTGLYKANEKVIGADPNVIVAGQALILDCSQAALPEQVQPVLTSDILSGPVSTAGDSGFQACVISRESGGNPNVMNSTGHYGLYQFSAGTWAAYGGNPADFGDASVAEQNQVFDNAMAQDGEFNWAPYDGC